MDGARPLEPHKPIIILLLKRSPHVMTRYLPMHLRLRSVDHADEKPLELRQQLLEAARARVSIENQRRNTRVVQHPLSLS